MAKERIAAERRVAHDLGSSWSEVATRYGMPEKTVRSWSGGDITPAAQHNRRETTGRSRRLTAAEKREILQ
jgi:transposase